MSVLGEKRIKERSEEIFSDNYDESQVQPAAYELRASETEAKKEDTVYTRNKEYRENNENAKRKGCFELPARRISVISSKEELSLPDDICARVGIRLTYSKEGLIPLFGPQVDPGYEGRFYAVIYNASGEPVEIHQREKGVFKMILQDVKGSKAVKSEEDRYKMDYVTDDFDDLDDGITNLSDIKTTFTEEIDDVRDEREKKIDRVRDELDKRITENEGDISTAETTITEVKRGYRQVVMFGVFLLATSSFGIVYSILIKSVQANGFKLGINFVTIFTGIFLVGWVLGIGALLYQFIKRTIPDND